MSEVLVYFAFFGFIAALFPIHIFNYVYVSAKDKYASVNVSAYRIIRIFNVNTVKNSLDKMQINGEETKVNFGFIKSKWLKIFNNLCFVKMVQLCDYGLKNQSNAYFALAQKTLTDALFAFIKINGGKTKLKNYIVFNLEHDYINCYLKAVGVINLITVLKIIFILFTEKLNERKIKK